MLSDVGLNLLKEDFMWPTFEDETHVLSFLFHVLSLLLESYILDITYFINPQMV